MRFRPRPYDVVVPLAGFTRRAVTETKSLGTNYLPTAHLSSSEVTVGFFFPQAHP